MSVELTNEIKAVLEENDNCPMTVQAIARRITERKRYKPDGQEIYAFEVFQPDTLNSPLVSVYAMVHEDRTETRVGGSDRLAEIGARGWRADTSFAGSRAVLAGELA